MTERLYRENVYLRECTSTVLSVSREGCLVLDRSLFFPASGGQPGDLGSINGIPLAEVYEKDGEVLHRLFLGDAAISSDAAEPLFRVGAQVTCSLDWDRRFDHMQRHCGEHILSGIFFREYGGVNRGFHMGSDYMTIDIDLPSVSPAMARHVELLANEVIWSDAPVSIRYFQSSEEASRLPLRKGITIESDVSIVCVGDEAHPADCVACCGTHPSTAGQIGLIKLLKFENYKGMSRIYFEAGRRAFLHTVREHQLISTLAEKYSSDENTLADKIQIQEDKNQSTRQALQKYKDLLIAREIEALMEAISLPAQEQSGCPQVIVREYDQLSLEDLQLLAKGITLLSQDIFILISIQEKALLMSRAASKDIEATDLGALIKAGAGNFNGKGGGSPTAGRASFQSLSDLDDFMTHAVDLLLV